MLSHLEGYAPPAAPATLLDHLHGRIVELGVPERWILSRLATAVSFFFLLFHPFPQSRIHLQVDKINAGLSSFDLSLSTQAFRSFFLYDFCDVYIEWSKLSLRDTVTSEVSNTRSPLYITAFENSDSGSAEEED